MIDLMIVAFTYIMKPSAQGRRAARSARRRRQGSHRGRRAPRLSLSAKALALAGEAEAPSGGTGIAAATKYQQMALRREDLEARS